MSKTPTIRKDGWAAATPTTVLVLSIGIDDWHWARWEYERRLRAARDDRSKFWIGHRWIIRQQARSLLRTGAPSARAWARSELYDQRRLAKESAYLLEQLRNGDPADQQFAAETLRAAAFYERPPIADAIVVALLETSKSSDPGVRGNSLTALSQYAGLVPPSELPAILDAVVLGLNDSDRSARGDAIDALRLLADNLFVHVRLATLTRLTTDPLALESCKTVRHKRVNGSGFMWQMLGSRLLEHHPAVRRAAVLFWVAEGSLPSESTLSLIHLLNAEEPNLPPVDLEPELANYRDTGKLLAHLAEARRRGEPAAEAVISHLSRIFLIRELDNGELKLDRR